jgi:CTP:molybdopterin cytidylyltransferase MocA
LAVVTTAKDTKNVSTAAVVLAAGGGSRFGGDGHKLLAPFRGRPLVAWALDAAAVLDELLVVTGAVELGDLVPPGARVVHNERWAEGQATSLAAAIAAAADLGHEAVVIGLGDQPLIPAEAWRLVAAATATPIAVATYGGARRNPVRLAAEVWPLLPPDGDEGARGLVRGRGDLVTEVACPGEPADMDTQEDLATWS